MYGDETDSSEQSKAKAEPPVTCKGLELMKVNLNLPWIQLSFIEFVQNSFSESSLPPPQHLPTWNFLWNFKRYFTSFKEEWWSSRELCIKLDDVSWEVRDVTFIHLFCRFFLVAATNHCIFFIIFDIMLFLLTCFCSPILKCLEHYEKDK